MTNDPESCKLCDERLIFCNSMTLEQQIVEYNGVRVEARKQPTLSSAENIVEPCANY